MQVNFKLKAKWDCRIDLDPSIKRQISISLGRRLHADGIDDGIDVGCFVGIRVGADVGISVGAQVGLGAGNSSIKLQSVTIIPGPRMM